MIRFPRNVLELILDNTGDGYIGRHRESPHLPACSLVCKDWRPVAQSLLFKEMRFPVNKPLYRVLAFLTAAPHISIHVRSLGIWRFEHDLEHQGCGIQPHILYKLMVALPKLQKLDLFRVVLHRWNTTVPFPTVPVKLHSLVLTDLVIDFHPTRYFADQAFDFLRLFDAQKMRITGGVLPLPYLITRPPVNNILAVPGVPLPAVRDLHIYGQSLFIEVNDGNGGLNPNELSSLSLEPTVTFGNTLPFYNRFIRRYSKTIRHLNVNIGRALGKSETADIWENLNVASCTQLKSLRLRWTHNGWAGVEKQYARVCEAYRAILSTTSPRLLELCLVVESSWARPSDTPFAETAHYIASILIHGVEKLQDLQSVTLEISTHLDLEKSADAVKALLPKSFVNRQLLHFKAHHGPSF